FGLGVFSLGLRFRRRGLGCVRWCALARDSPGVLALLRWYVAQRPLIGPLGILFGGDFRGGLAFVGLAVLGHILGQSRPGQQRDYGNSAQHSVQNFHAPPP